jgi:glycosyltransferase involved in cell wall biosynthesis
LRALYRTAPAPVRTAVGAAATAIVHGFGRVRGAMARGGLGGAPVCVLGLHRSTIGLGRGARLFRAALEADGIATSAIDVSAHYAHDVTLPLDVGDVRAARAMVAHLNPVELVHAVATLAGPRPRKGLRVGYWAWETETPPENWAQGFDVVDEVWCPSAFTAAAIERLGRGRAPVRVVPHPASPVRGARDRARFGFRSDEVMILSACDLLSSAARKNPMGAIEAFRRAGRGRGGAARLLLKVSGGAHDPVALASLEAAAAATQGVTLMTERLDEQGMADLIASVDIVLSPHRSEGFGLLPAEAMACGLPVIATGWSGNLDFMDADCAALLDWKPVAIVDPKGNYRAGVWADPDLDQAADWIARLVDDADLRAGLGARARARMTAFNDPGVWLSRVRPWLGLPAKPQAEVSSA